MSGGIGGIASIVMSMVYPDLKQLFEASARRITVTVEWRRGTQTRTVELVQWVVNPTQGVSADQADLVSAYQEADLLVHPSLYEGFGFPPLEAMACGTPVVSSDRTSLPEVLGDAALLVDPEDAEALAGAMARVLDDETLRDSLRQKGLERARIYTWQRAAQQTMDVYRAAVEARGKP